MISGPFPYVRIELDSGNVGYIWKDPPRASVRPLFTWALVIFLAGAIFGAVLSTTFAAGGPSSFPAPVYPPESELIVESTAAIAAPASDAIRLTTSDPIRDDPATAVARGGAHGPVAEATTEAAVMGEKAPPPVAEIVRAAAVEFEVDVDELLELAMCESSLRAHAVGRAQEIGLFQWKPRTWESNAPRLGYTINDIVDPVAQARLTALVLREDGGWRWTCAGGSR